ncbi:EAL domain-containing protein [Shewanella pneumatophori]|uniref:EAL domain-containing protein n=1 Tax=Shewanella pneumatophori TaxID=314092 RepID=A0A9X2CEQ3_9GAMM|nr:EAL domain-containing protein [Shewanella pneumatophori]MCL1140523.1 EAL domain-containing protein [Shewanella pneumatophori]
MPLVLSQLSLRNKLFLSVFIPMVILVLLAVMSAAVLFKQYQNATSNVLTTRVTLGIENLIYELQNEHGLSAGYISSNGRLFKSALQQQWLTTDQNIQGLISSPSLLKTINNTKSNLELFNALQTQLSQSNTAQKNLVIERQNILELNAPHANDFYSATTQHLINFVSKLRFNSDNSDQVLLLSDLINMLKIQNLAGQERSFINQLLASPTLDHLAFQQYVETTEQLENSINNSLMVMSPNSHSNLTAFLNSEQYLLILNYREQLQRQFSQVIQIQAIEDLIGHDGINDNFNHYVATLNPKFLTLFRQKDIALKQALHKLANEHELTLEQQTIVTKLQRLAEDYQVYANQIEESQSAIPAITLKLMAQDVDFHNSLHQLQQQPPVINSLDWWQAADVGISKLHKLNTQLTEKIIRQNEIEKQQILSYFYISFIASLLFFYLIYLLGKNITQNLMNSVTGIVDDVEKLAQDPGLELDLAVKGNDEFAQISIAINQMVSERMKSKQALHRASAVFEHSSEGIMVTDADNNIELVNPAFTKITGYSLSDVKGKNPRILNSAHHPSEFYQKLWQSLAKHNEWEGEIWNKRKDGQIYPEYLKITAVKNCQNEITQHIGLFLDTSNYKQYEQDLWYKSNYDALTKLPNRHLFSSRLQQAIDNAKQSNAQVAIFFIDLDRFKYINELHGHASGNKVLKLTAARLETVLGPNDSIARFGGDEFVVIAPQAHNSDGAESLAQKLSEALSRPYILEGKETNISSSFGIAFYPEDGQDLEMLLHNSETAMYQAKRNGRAHYQYYAPEMNVEMLARMHLEQRLRKAVKQGEFHLEYQPIVDMRSGVITSVEALIRWQDPDYGLISPESFIPIAEETGLIEPLGEWILHQALADLADIHAQGIALCMAINVSARQCMNSKGICFSEVLKQALATHGIEAKDVHIEITESLLIEDKPLRLECLDAIKQLGVDIYLDDFGTGYSALSYLTQCPISVIKIDKSFIDNIADNPSDVKLIRAILMMAKNLELPLVAEGVETLEQWNFLQALNCDYAQGYLISRPVAKQQLLAFLQQSKPLQYLSNQSELKAVTQ